jgi:hypothetical protein
LLSSFSCLRVGLRATKWNDGCQRKEPLGYSLGLDGGRDRD